MKTKKAFTLVELLVVIAILAILATATIVGFTAFTEKAKLSNLEGELKQVTEMLQLEDYYNGNYEIVEPESGDRVIIFHVNTTDESRSSVNVILKNCSDGELANYAKENRLVYTVAETEVAGTEQTITISDLVLLDSSSPHELQAEWNVDTNKITSGKYSG